MTYAERIAQITPGDPIPHDLACWVIAGFHTYAEATGTLPLDVCFGIRRRADKKSAKELRDSHLCVAYAIFEPEQHRVNANRVLQFSKTVKAFGNTYRQFQRTGRLPSGRFELYLFLAFDAYRVPASESQLRRIVQPF